MLQVCTVVTSTEMQCLMPPLGIRQRSVLYVRFGFLMDGVKALEDISKSQPDIGKMRLLPNPVADPFPEEGGVREYDPEGLVIRVSGVSEECHLCHCMSRVICDICMLCLCVITSLCVVMCLYVSSYVVMSHFVSSYHCVSSHVIMSSNVILYHHTSSKSCCCVF